MNKPAAVTVKKTVSKDEDVAKAMASLAKTHILVGIASGSKGDARTDGGPKNHELGFIHEYGSPSRNIPARPFLIPGVRNASAKAVKKMQGAIKAGLHGDRIAMDALLEQAGMIAVSGAKKEISSGNFEPLKPSTLRNRHRSRMTKGKRENELKGEDVRPLINTGALRDSIDYIVVKGKGK